MPEIQLTTKSESTPVFLSNPGELFWFAGWLYVTLAPENRDTVSARPVATEDDDGVLKFNTGSADVEYLSPQTRVILLELKALRGLVY